MGGVGLPRRWSFSFFSKSTDLAATYPQLATHALPEAASYPEHAARGSQLPSTRCYGHKVLAEAVSDPEIATRPTTSL